MQVIREGMAGASAKIFIVSVLGLFLELLLIRWIGSEIHLFAYVQNVILIACFLGLGLGCFTCRERVDLRGTLVSLVILLALMAIPRVRIGLLGLSDVLSIVGRLEIFTATQIEEQWLLPLAAAAVVMTWLLLVLVVDCFVPLGRLLGRLLQEHPDAIRAYATNVAGSLAGVWLFVAASAGSLSPTAWFGASAALLLMLMAAIGQRGAVNLALLAALVPIAWLAGLNPGASEVVWSPYQKLVVGHLHEPGYLPTEYGVLVNSTGYQELLDLSVARIAADPVHFAPEQRGLSQYDLPLLLHPDPRRYLVVGAGSGNDVAGGLRNGAREITAVDIDPAIIDIGRRLHPEQPYAAASVTIVNDDARSFFAKCHERFDVISFGLLDSHTATAMANARLDHYVYTVESLARARSLLAEHGIMVLTFNQNRLFVADRIGRALEQVFGRRPVAFLVPGNFDGGGGFMFIAGDLEGVARQLARQPRLGAWIAHLQAAVPLGFPGTTPLATDDWPYLYLQSRAIPPLYFLLGLLMLGVLMRSCVHWRATTAFGRWRRPHWHFSALGAAFLLLEVQNISKASVVLGNTWQTNAAIMSGVLMMALLAALGARRFPRERIRWVYAMLMGSTLGLYFIDLAQFAFLPYAVNVLVVGGLTSLPLLFSGIVFACSFADATERDEAIGANIVGAVLGALLQSVSFVVGIKALLLVVAAFYGLAFLTRGPVRAAAA